MSAPLPSTFPTLPAQKARSRPVAPCKPAFCGPASSAPVHEPQRHQQQLQQRHSILQQHPAVKAPLACHEAVPQAQTQAQADSNITWPRWCPERYTFGDQLGKGSFGTVSAVFDRQEGKRRAVKVIPKQRKNVPVTYVAEKIRMEVDFLRQLQDIPEAVRLDGVLQDDDNVYIVTELCSGGTLENFLLTEGNLTEVETAKVMRDILAVIRGCHLNSICYADVKPANFLLKNIYPDPRCLVESKRQTDRPFEVRVVDFGCSQRIRKGEQLQKRTGTPLYMAPETFMGYFGQECDMWSLGMLLHQMLVGRLPFWGGRIGQNLRISPMMVMQGILSGDLDFEADGWESISEEAKDLVQRLLDRDHTTRITADEAWSHPWLQHNCHEEEGCDLASEFLEMSSRGPSSTDRPWHETPAGSHVVQNAWAHQF